MHKNYNLKTIFLVFIFSLFFNSSFYGQIATLDLSGNFKVNGYSGLWWDYQYKPTGSSIYTQSAIQQNASSSLLKLNPFISWDFKIRYYNTFGQPGAWSQDYTVNSAYQGISKSVGYNFNFDSSSLDEGWRGYRLQNTTSNTYSNIEESNYIFRGTSGKSLFMGWQSGYQTLLVSPKIIDLSTDKKFSFFANGYQGNYSFVVGTMSDPYDSTTFHPLKTVNLTGGSFQKIDVFLNNYANSDQYIAIKSSGNSGYIYFDDFNYEQSVNCFDLTNVAVNNISEHNATLNYDSNTANSYEINLKNLRTGETQIFTTNSTSYSFTTLAGLTNYEVKVRGNCATGLYTNWSSVISFTTPCTVVTSGYFTSFGEEYTIDPCWKKITSSTTINNTTGLNINGVIVVPPKSGSKMVTISASSDTNQKGYLISPFISDLDTNKRIKFYLGSYDSDYIDRSITIGTMSNPLDESTFVPIKDIQPEDINQYNGYKVNGYLKEHIIYFNNYNSSLNHNYIAFKVNNSANYNDVTLFIDDFTYENIPFCKEPTNLKCTRTDYNYAILKWDTFDQSSSEWEIEYGIKGFSIGNGIRLNVNSNVFTINSNLIDSQEYDFYVRTKCGNSYSNWSDRGTFKTKCAGVNPGYTTSFENEDFENRTTCWSRITPDVRNSFYSPNSFVSYETAQTSNGITPNSGASMTEIFSYRMYADNLVNDKTILVTPRLNDLNSNKKISFYAHIPSSIYSNVTRIEVGTLSDIEDYTTFTPYEIISTNIALNQWKEYTVDFSTYSGTNQHVGIRVFATNSSNLRIFIDDFKYLPNDCNRPSNLTAIQESSTSVVLNWNTNNTNPVNCEIEYGPLGFTPGTGTLVTASSLPLEVNGLNTNSNYEFRVRNICNSSTINWSNKYAFKISCAVNVPFEDNFDQYTATNFELIPENICWSTNKSTNDQTDAGVNRLFYTNFNSSPNAFYLYNSSSQVNSKDLYLISPYLSDFNNGKRIKFWLNKNLNHQQTLVVGTLSNPLDINTFVPYRTFITNDLSVYGKEINVDFSEYSGNNKYVAFKLLPGDYSTKIFIDDFKYLETPNCVEPINIQFHHITDHSTLIKWNDTANATVEIEYGLSGFTPGTGLLVSSNTNQIEITGLNESTQYDFYLKTNCSTNLSSSIVQKFITTACQTQTMPWTENFANLTSYGVNQLPNCMEVTYGSVETINVPRVLYSSYYNPDHTLNGNGDSSYILLNQLHPNILSPAFELIAGVTYKFAVDGRKAYEYRPISLRLFVGRGRGKHYMEVETKTNGQLREYSYSTNSFYFTPLENGIYSFILQENSSPTDAHMILDNFTLSEGYTNTISSNYDAFNFQNGQDSKIILESTQNSSVDIQPEINNISNSLLKMAGANAPSNWNITPNEIWENNQNHITKVNMKINANSMTSLFLLFDLKQTFVNFSNESMFRVVVNGTVLGNIIRPTTNDQDIFKTFQYDLTPFVGSDIRVSLQHIGKSSNDIGDNAYLDNLRFSPIPLLSTNENSFVGLKYYPNPVSNILNIENNSDISSIEIFNLIGQSIFKQKYSSKNITIDTNNLESGAYLIKITSEEKTKTLKIIKD